MSKLFNKSTLGYVEKDGLLGAVVGADFRNKTVSLQDDNGEIQVYYVKDVELLEEIGELYGVTVFDKDVLGAINGKAYEIELHSDGEVQMHLLNKQLERVSSGDKFKWSDEIAEDLGAVFELQGSIYELRDSLPKIDFNIKIVKDFKDGVITYFYACNNKATEEIDLIKVVFVGQHLLKEEDYERVTLSHEKFLNSMKNETLKEVSQQELMNYATGAMYGRKEAQPSVQNQEDEEEVCCEECEEECGVEVAETHCNDCEKELDDCDCELW